MKCKSMFIEMFGSPDNNVFNYPVSTIADISHEDLSYGSTASAVDYNGKIRYIRITDITDSGSLNDDIKSPSVFDEKYVLHEGDVLFARSGATAGKTYLYNMADGEAIYAGYLIRSVPKKDVVNPKYLYYFTKSAYYENFLTVVKRGAAQPNINAQQYGSLKICVPPIEKQNAFSEFVQQVDKSRNVCKRLFESFDKLVKSRFIEMFDNNPDHTKWPIQSMNQVCEVITDGSHYSPKNTDGGYPMLSVKDMGNSDFNYADCKYISQKEYDNLVKNGCKPLAGDVLIAKDGSFFKKGFVVKEEREQAVLSSIAIIRPKNDLMNPEYLVKYLLSDKVVSSVSTMTSGTALKRVILMKFKLMKITVPPIDLQNQFAEFVEQVDKSRFKVIQSLTKLLESTTFE